MKINNRKIQQCLKIEFQKHPEARLIDYYKLFYQDAFGPGHYVQNRKIAYENLKMEVQQAVNFENWICQNINCINNYYRINLVILRDYKIDYNDFFNLIIASIKPENHINSKEWKEEWISVFKNIRILNIPVKEFEKDRLFIKTKLVNSIPIFKHSKIYKKKYNPHYRIIEKNQLDKLCDNYPNIKTAIKDMHKY